VANVAASVVAPSQPVAVLKAVVAAVAVATTGLLTSQKTQRSNSDV
jgi:hypothetical protein